MEDKSFTLIASFNIAVLKFPEQGKKKKNSHFMICK